MPVGVQIASLFADGVSLLTTEKTLTDHGISAVAGEDCAMWRGLDGDDICRAPDAVELADAGAVSEPWTDAEEGGDILPFSMLEPTPPSVALADAGPAPQPEAPSTEKTEIAAAAAKEPAWSPPPPDPQTPQAAEPAQPDAARPAPAVEPVVVVETKLAPPPVQPKTPGVPPLAAVAPDGGTFYVIASYRRIANADRLARQRADLKARVLAGTVKGIAVYRVAVGPVAKAERRRVRARLAGAGFADAWKVKLEKPKLALELAAAE